MPLLLKRRAQTQCSQSELATGMVEYPRVVHDPAGMSDETKALGGRVTNTARATAASGKAAFILFTRSAVAESSIGGEDTSDSSEQSEA